MPTIQFKLEDPTLCEGCPFDRDGSVDCKAGFDRQFLKIVQPENEQKAKEVGRWMIWEMHDDRPRTEFVRPQACILTEVAAAKLGGTLLKEKKKGR